MAQSVLFRGSKQTLRRQEKHKQLLGGPFTISGCDESGACPASFNRTGRAGDEKKACMQGRDLLLVLHTDSESQY